MKITAEKARRCLFSFLSMFALILAIMNAFYSDGLYEKSMMKIAKRAYYEKIELTSNLLREVENLHKSCTSLEKDVLFNSFIIATVEEIDRQYGIYARVIDLDGRQLSRAFLAEGEDSLALLLDADDYDFEKDLGFVKDSPSGNRQIVSKNGVKIHLHWMCYPVTENHYYYILLGIVYDRVIDTIDYNAFATGQVIVMLALIACLFCIVYLQSKINKSKQIDVRTDDRN